MEGTATENLPRKIGRFEIAGLISERASPAASQIFIGVDPLRTSSAKSVVIKRLATALTTDSSVASSFLAAVRDIAKGLRHENVLEIRFVGHEGKDMFLVVDYVHGETLARVVQRLRDRVESLSPVLGAFIVSQACKGLDAAHGASLVHGHLTPADIFVGYDGSVKVLDIGVAEAKANLAKRANVPLGPVDEEYAAPEQRDRKPIDRRSDVFSLGKILLEIGSARLAEIAKGALDPDPAKRYPDAAALGKALDAYVGTAPARSELGQLLARLFDQRIRDKKALVERLSAKSATKDLSALDYKEEHELLRPSGEAVAMLAAPVSRDGEEHPADLDAKIPSGISKPTGGAVTSGAKVVVHRPQSDPSLRTSHPQPPRSDRSVPPQVDPVESVQPISIPISAPLEPPPPPPRYVDDTEARQRRQEETAVVARRSPGEPFVVVPPQKSGSKGLKLVVVGLLVLGGVSAAIVVLRRRQATHDVTASTSTAISAVTSAPPSAAPPPPPPPPPPVVASEAPPPVSSVSAKAEEMSIMVDTVPAHATISIGGTKMGVSPAEIKLPKSSEPVTLEIKHAGYLTLKEKVTPNLNQRLKLTLVPAKGGAQPAASNPYRKFE